MSAEESPSLEQEDEPYQCKECKISYSSEQELKEHTWSLMHHIKLEQRNKGSTHYCIVCFETSPSIIEYGKHLNGEKHKHAVEADRGQREEENAIQKAILQSKLSKEEESQMAFLRATMNDSENISDPEMSSKGKKQRNNWNKSKKRGHARSFSQPQPFRGVNKKGQWNNQYQNPFPRKQGHFNRWKQGFEPNYKPQQNECYWQDDFSREPMHYPQNQAEFWKDDPNFYNGPTTLKWQWGQYGEKILGNQGTGVTQMPSSSYMGDGRKERTLNQFRYANDSRRFEQSMPSWGKNNGHGVSTNRNGVSEEPSSNELRNQFEQQERFVHEQVQGFAEKKWPSDNIREDNGQQDSVSDTNKRRRQSEEENRASRSVISSANLQVLDPNAWQLEDNLHEIHQIPQVVQSCDNQPNKRFRYPSGSKNETEPDSTTDAEGMAVTAVSSFTRNEVPGPSDNKNRISKASSGFDNVLLSANFQDNSVLERAERLCKELREKRERAKKEKEKKERLSKFQKTKEINSQIEELNSKTKGYVKGHLSSIESDQEKLEKFLPPSGKNRTKISERKFNKTMSETEPEKSVPQTKTKLSKKTKEKEHAIDDIQRQIEQEVKKSKEIGGSRKARSTEDLLDTTRCSPVLTSDHKSQGSLHVPSKDAQISTLPSDKDKTGGIPESTKSSLVKMVNSPRSRKERQCLADILRSYAHSKDKLTLPRFNLQMSDFDDLEKYEMMERAEELHLEDLSADVQLQIAELIESDVNPDIDMLEEKLFSCSSQKTSKINSKFMDSVSIDEDLLSSLGFAPKENSTSNITAKDAWASLSKKDKHNASSSDSLHMPTEMSKGIKDEKVIDVHGKENTNDGHSFTASDRILENIAIKEEPEFLKNFETPKSSVFSSVSNLHSLSVHSKSISAPSSCELRSIQNDSNTLTTPCSKVDSPAYSKAETKFNISQENDNISQSSSLANSHPESLFDLVYEISLQEEELRKELSNTNNEISRLNSIIQEAAQKLDSQKRKRQQLEEKEEVLRTRRMKILKDGRSQAGSVCSIESLPVGATATSFVKTTGSTSAKLDYLSNPLLPTVNMEKSVSIGTCSEKLPNTLPLHSVQVNLNTSTLTNNSAPVRMSVRDSANISPIKESSLHASGIHKHSQHHEEKLFKEPPLTARSKSKSALHTPRLDSNLSKPAESARDFLKEKVQYDLSRQTLSLPKNQHSNPGSPNTSFHSLVAESDSSDEDPNGSDRPVSEQPESKPTLDASISGKPQPDLKKLSSMPELKISAEEPLFNHKFSKDVTKSDCDTSQSSDLSKAGFVTLKSLLKSQSVDHSTEIIDKDAQKILKPFLETGTIKSPDSTSSGRVNIKYMGSLPRSVFNGDIENMLKQINATNVKKTDEKSQLEEKEEGYKSESSIRSDDKAETESNYDSMASNMSLGTQIKQYCQQNDAKAAELNADNGSESDNTLKDGSNSESNLNQTVILNPNAVQGMLPPTGASPIRKKRKTKKERDRKSPRKQKEDLIPRSSSDCSSPEEGEEENVTHEQVRTKLVFQGSDRISETEYALVETGSEGPFENEQVGMDIDQLPTEQYKGQSHDSNGPYTRTRDDSGVQSLSSKGSLMNGSSSTDTTMDQTMPTSGEDVQSYKGPSEPVTAVIVKEHYLYVAYQMSSPIKFNIQSGKKEMDFPCDGYYGNCIALVDLGRVAGVRLFVGGSQMLFHFHANKTEQKNFRNGQLISRRNVKSKIQCMHETSGNLYIGGDTGDIQAYKARSGKVLFEPFHLVDQPIMCIRSGSEGVRNLIFVSACTSPILVVDSLTGLLLRTIEGHSKTVFCMQPMNQYLFSGSGDKTVMKHNACTGDLEYTIKDFKGIVTCMTLENDSYLFCGGYDKYIRCYDLKSACLHNLLYGAGHTAVTAMAIDNGKLFSGNRGGLVEAVPFHGNQKLFRCQWTGCSCKFGGRQHLYYHLCTDHYNPALEKFSCLWTGCQFSVNKPAQNEILLHMRNHIN